MESQPKGGKYLIFLRKGFFFIAKPVLSCFVLRSVLRPFLEPFLAFLFWFLRPYFPISLRRVLEPFLKALFPNFKSDVMNFSGDLFTKPLSS